MPNQDTDLIEYVIQSIQNRPHHWVFENNELENTKAKITVNKIRISTLDEHGRPLVQSIDSVFSGTFNAILRYYNEYVVLQTQHRIKQMFPLDLYYQILEDIEQNYFDWNEHSHSIINHKLNIEINVDLSLFRTNSCINNLPISNDQAVEIMMILNQTKDKIKKTDKKSLIEKSLTEVEDLRGRFKNT